MKALAKQKSLVIDIALFMAVAAAALLAGLQVKNQIVAHYLGFHKAQAAVVDQQLAQITADAEPIQNDSEMLALADQTGCSCPMCCAPPPPM